MAHTRLIVAFAGLACILAATMPVRANAAEPAPAATPVGTDAGTGFTWSKEAFDAAANYSAKNSGRAMLVMRDGEVLYERYDNGWSATRPHPLASGT